MVFRHVLLSMELRVGVRYHWEAALRAKASIRWSWGTRDDQGYRIDGINGGRVTMGGNWMSRCLRR